MTAVAVARSIRSVVMAGDSAVDDDGVVWKTGAPKVRRRGGYLVGIAGDSLWFSVASEVRWPKRPTAAFVEGGGLLRELVRGAELVAPLASISKQPEGDSVFEGYMLIAALIGGKPVVWMTNEAGDMDVLNGDHAIGSGGEAARAAMLGLGPTVSPTERALRALEIASEVRSDVREPFSLETLV